MADSSSRHHSRHFVNRATSYASNPRCLIYPVLTDISSVSAASLESEIPDEDCSRTLFDQGNIFLNVMTSEGTNLHRASFVSLNIHNNID